MSLHKADGSRVTATNISTTDYEDKLVVLGDDLTRKTPYGPSDDSTNGRIATLDLRAGTVLHQSEVDALFSEPQVTAIEPASGAQAGGNVVTLRGSKLDGISGVKFGANAGTAVTVKSSFEVDVTVPAGDATGDVAVKVTGDTGEVDTGLVYTYTA